VDEGAIASIEDQVRPMTPQLKATAYERATRGNVLNIASGVHL